MIDVCSREAGSPVFANTVNQSAWRTPDIQHFVPVSTQPPSTSGPASPSCACPRRRSPPGARRARRRCALCPVRDPRQVALLLLLGARDHDRAGREAREQQHQPRDVRVLGDLLDRDREPHDPRARAAVGLRDAQPEEPRVAERVEEVLRVLAGAVHLARPRLDLVLGEAAHRVAQRRQLVGELEVHRVTVANGATRAVRRDPRRTRRSARVACGRLRR